MDYIEGSSRFNNIQTFINPANLLNSAKTQFSLNGLIGMLGCQDDSKQIPH